MLSRHHREGCQIVFFDCLNSYHTSLDWSERQCKSSTRTRRFDAAVRAGGLTNALYKIQVADTGEVINMEENWNSCSLVILWIWAGASANQAPENGDLIALRGLVA